MMKLNSNVACIEYKNKVILANKLTGMWLRITKEIYNYFIKALELNYERKDFVRSFMSADCHPKRPSVPCSAVSV